VGRKKLDAGEKGSLPARKGNALQVVEKKKGEIDAATKNDSRGRTISCGGRVKSGPEKKRGRSRKGRKKKKGGRIFTKMTCKES